MKNPVSPNNSPRANVLEHKSFAPADTSLLIKDVDTKRRRVSGYASVFGVLDAHNEVVTKGAFKKSIQEHAPGVPGARRPIFHLWMHKMEYPIAHPVELREDDYGLYFESEFLNNQKATDVLEMYERGIIKQHSIGFFYERDKYFHVEKGAAGENYYEIKGARLFEFSSVLIGANEEAQTNWVKSAQNGTLAAGDLDALNKDMAAYAGFVSSGKASDEALQFAELRLLDLSRKYNEIILALQTQEPPTGTPAPEEPRAGLEDDDIFNFFI